MVQTLNDGSNDAGAARLRRRADEKRQVILRAAGRVFRKRGFAATGMREIAAEADLSPGNLYYYFRGKQELLYYCQEQALERMVEALGQARLSGAHRADQLRAVIEAHVRCLLDEVEGSAAHLELDALEEEMRTRIVAQRDRYERGIRHLISEGMQRGEFAACDAKLVTRAILGAMNWTARWFDPEGPRRAATVAVSLSDYLVRGLRPSASASRSADEGVSR